MTKSPQRGWEQQMAGVWLVKEGSQPTSGDEPFRKLSVAECVTQLGLSEGNYLCDLATPPRFNEASPTKVRGPQHVVVEIDEAEARAHKWKPGFYSTSVSAEEALKRLSVTVVSSHL